MKTGRQAGRKEGRKKDMEKYFVSFKNDKNVGLVSPYSSFEEEEKKA